MIASISHDLKTPLTSIRAYAEALVLSKNEEDKVAEYCRVIAEKSNYMKQMIDDLLMYTLLQQPNYEMERTLVEGDEFFDMLLSGYEPLCEEKDIDLETHCEVEGMYLVNPKQMLRVMDNLVSNAFKHVNQGGHILLAAFHAGKTPSSIMPQAEKYVAGRPEGVYLIVQNSGEGMHPSELEHVFKPLYQADTARTKQDGSGTGLGLSISKQIIEKHGGTIEIVSEIKAGTCVICWLPEEKGDGENEIQ